MKKPLSIIVLFVLLTGCTPQIENTLETEIENSINILFFSLASTLTTTEDPDQYTEYLLDTAMDMSDVSRTLIGTQVMNVTITLVSYSDAYCEADITVQHGNETASSTLSLTALCIKDGDQWKIAKLDSSPTILLASPTNPVRLRTDAVPSTIRTAVDNLRHAGGGLLVQEDSNISVLTIANSQYRYAVWLVIATGEQTQKFVAVYDCSGKQTPALMEVVRCRQ